MKNLAPEDFQNAQNDLSRSGSWADSARMDSSAASWGDRPNRRPGISSADRQAARAAQRDANKDRIVDAAIAAGQRSVAESPSGDQFRIGDDVVHGKWGEGVVLDLQGSGDKTEITIHFPTVGQKVLLLAWAPLKKA